LDDNRTVTTWKQPKDDGLGLWAGMINYHRESEALLKNSAVAVDGVGWWVGFLIVMEIVYIIFALALLYVFLKYFSEDKKKA